MKLFSQATDGSASEAALNNRKSQTKYRKWEDRGKSDNEKQKRNIAPWFDEGGN